MGRIKSTYVKTSATKIYNKNREDFTDKFTENKAAVDKHAKIPSKKMKNSVVGYITRLVKQSSTNE